MRTLSFILIMVLTHSLCFADKYICEFDKSSKELVSSYTIADDGDIPESDTRKIVVFEVADKDTFDSVELAYKNNTYGKDKKDKKVKYDLITYEIDEVI